jgi:hypothetical protein
VDNKDAIGFPADILSRVPIPLVRLPPICINAPWWLVYVGHEVGHHIQADLGLPVKFADRVEEAARKHGAKDGEEKKWRAWSPEIFADVFSVLMMGQWAVAAMADLDLMKHAAMLVRRDTYPSPWVRLRLLAHTTEKVGLKVSPAQLDPDPEAPPGQDMEAQVALDEQTKRDLRVMPHVVEAALGTLPDLQVTLKQLCDFRLTEFQEGGDVDRWGEALRGITYRPIEKNLRAARLVTSGARAAWAKITELPDVDRKQARDALTPRALTFIAESAEEGTRAGFEPVEVEGDRGRELAEFLLST